MPVLQVLLNLPLASRTTALARGNKFNQATVFGRVIHHDQLGGPPGLVHRCEKPFPVPVVFREAEMANQSWQKISLVPTNRYKLHGIGSQPYTVGSGGSCE